MLREDIFNFSHLIYAHETKCREKCFKKYSNLISSLLVVEQNNELLTQNHESQQTGTTPFLETNVEAWEQLLFLW